MTVIGNPTYCQLNRHLLFHLNNHTHALTPNTHDHQPIHYTITLNMNPNNLHLISTYHVSNKDSTTILVHPTPYPARSSKRKRHSRTTATLPITNYTIALLFVRPLLHQKITVTHLILITPSPSSALWYILHTPQRTIYIYTSFNEF